MTQGVRDYSRVLAAGSVTGSLMTTGRALLQGAAAAVAAREAVLWIPPDGLTGAPLATCPADLASRRVEVARRLARQAISGGSAPVPHAVVAVTGDAADPNGVFVFVRRRDHPFSSDDREILTRLSPLLAVGVSTAIAAGDGGGAASVVDPSRATLDLLATLAHEMRTPLASIKGYATAILSEPPPWDHERVEQALQIIDQETSTLTTLISELLEAAAIDSGRMVIEPEPVLLHRMLERLVAEFRIQTTRHEFITRFPARFPAVHADPRRMEQVFRNILDNAVKYSPHGGPVIVSGTARRHEVVLSVADRGIGIAPTDLNRLFEKFFRARKSVRVAGSGLGLPIAHAIVEQHGGRIWAESTPGKGTTMYVALPRRAPRAASRS
ncbi:MAG: HAMP domain-containing sensor histidine kinase [Armatimonadota bacterium]|nr:HAMP domain-containing sensor histidine kinase [Armatimonadota bacterium]